MSYSCPKRIVREAPCERSLARTQSRISMRTPAMCAIIEAH